MTQRQRVFIFGGGIAGLTAAHELAERGFEIVVYERDVDWESHTNGTQAALGGMAKSQWAFARPNGNAATSEASAHGPIKEASKAVVFRQTVLLPPTGNLTDLEHAMAGHHSGHALRASIRGSNVALETIRQKLQELERQGLSFTIETEVDTTLDPDRAQVDIRDPQARVLPAEHGFRFFPGFYRHVFDSMRRTPLSRPGDEEAPFDRPIRSVYDNLVPTRASGIGLEGAARNYEVTFPRTRVDSAREILEALQTFLRGAGYTLRDVSKFTLKMFQYMTTSNLRRREELEDISWWDFIEGESFEEPFRHDMDAAPAILGAMVAKKSDARTQGSVVVQLLMDQLGRGERTDALLNGPTTDAWFTPWRHYLEYRGVEFRQGELVDFQAKDVAGETQLLPVVRCLGREQPEPSEQFRDCYFMIATALPDLTGRPPADDPQGGLREGLAHRFLKACAALPETDDGSYADVLALSKFDTGNWNQGPQSPLQHLLGIQYFFHYNDRQFVSGHSVYLDSDWRLSAISQTRFWRRPAGMADGYDGICSVDIGDVWRETAFECVYFDESGEPQSSHEKRRCWGTTSQLIAQATLEQIRRATPDRDPVPKPLYYHLDQGLTFDGLGHLIGNETPYLVNRPGDWNHRPGRVQEEAPEHLKPGENLPLGYASQCNQWFLCGTYMKTHTRLTTMEAANESARHAVNGLLRQDAERRGLRLPDVDPCPVWNIEEEELPDLKWLKELDEKLYRRGLPHFVEILGLDELPDALLPGLRHVYEPILRAVIESRTRG